jgi:membrane protein required for colicin V production
MTATQSVDLSLAFLLAITALRGFWRGFLRESFGLLALVAGAAAAFQFSALAAAAMQQHVRLPAAAQTGAAFVVIFAVVHTVVNGAGAFFDRAAGESSLRSLNRIAGAAVGVGKGAAVTSVVLLFLHLFPFAPVLDEHIMASTIGRPLVSLAGSLVRFGQETATDGSPLGNT